MIFIKTGKPRAGKSYGATVDSFREAFAGNRVLVVSGSMKMDPGKLSALVQKRYPDADFDPLKRMRVLSDDECLHFWRHRIIDGKPSDLPFERLAESPPTLFVIDEAHMHFDARAWAERGRELTAYNSQHAKLGDMVIFITQFPALLDKRVRGFAQEYHVYRNLGFEKIWWFFRAPKRFLVSVYYGEPDRVTKPAEVHYIKMDQEIADCYDTSAGVGVIGRGTPEQARRKTGFSWRWIIVGGALLALALAYVPELFTRFILNRFKPEKSEVVVSSSSSALPRAAPGANGAETTRESVVKAEKVEAPVIRSVTNYGKRWKVTLSDGRIFTDETGGVAATGRDWIRLSTGEVVFLAPAVSKGPVASK